MSRRTKPVLPGQSRSAACQRKAIPSGCGRLQGHKGDCRPTLTVTTSPAVIDTEGGVEVHSADRYTVQPEAAKAPAKARKARRPKVVVIPMAEYTRLVAAADKHTRRSRYITSGRPSARLA